MAAGVFLKPFSLYLFISLTAGIITGSVLPDLRLSVFSFFVLVLLAIAFLFLKSLRKYFGIAVLCVMCVAGFLLIQARLFPNLPAHHIVHYVNDEKQWITGQIVSFSRHDKFKTKYSIHCQKIEDGQRRIRVTGKIHLSVYRPGKQDQFFIGDTIRFSSKLKPIRNFANPGGFDYKRFLLFQGVYASAWSDAKKIEKLNPSSQKNLFYTLFQGIENHRNGFYSFVLQQTKASDSGKILISLVTGKKEVLSADIRDLFSRAGISHLLAISGLHLSIVGLLFFSFFYWVLSFFKQLTISGRAKKLAGGVTIPLLFAYAVFTGFSPSTQRSFIMVVIVLISYFCEKPKDILSSFSMAGILILILDAAAVFAVSFQLSFAAVGFIIAGLSLLKKYNLSPAALFLSKIFMMICITVFATLGTAPLSAYYFNMVSGIGILSNLIAIPLIGFIVLPTGLFSMILFPFVPALSAKIVLLCCQLIQWTIVLADKVSLLPFGWSRVVTPDLIELVFIYIFFAVLFLFISKRYRIAFLFCGAVFMGACTFYGGHFINQRKPAPLSIHVLDVGQGSSSFIQTADKKNILVDGGGFSGLSSFDTGRFIVGPYLWKKRIRHLDYVILSHPEGDHLNGLVFILENFSVGTLVKNHDRVSTRAYNELLRICQDKKISIFKPSVARNQLKLGRTTLTFVDTLKVNPYKNLNENSLVFKLKYKDFTMLFAGDILAKREIKLVSMQQLNLNSRILLSPHHGSSTSSSKLFLDKIAPGSVIISCGWKNRYGFPHDKALQRYSNEGIQVFRTDNHGAVLITSDGTDYNITTHKGGS